MKAKETISGQPGGSQRPTRRTALKYLGLLSASAAGREFLAGWLPVGGLASGGLVWIANLPEDKETAASYSPQFFHAAEYRTVQALTERIVPSDDTPGAKEARVAEYIDFVVFSAAEFKPSLQTEWREGLAYLDGESQKRFTSSFAEAAEADRIRLLEEMSAPERDPRLEHPGFPFFRLAKEMTVEGFYTSKVGLIDVLDYQGMNYQADFPGCTHPEHQT
jgi:gluconate 2-dehydrogenase gamma chain